MSSLNYSIPCSLAIGLGANLPSKAGSPQTTLIKIRPLIENLIYEWVKSISTEENNGTNNSKNLTWYWSPLFKTDPIGGPINQPSFINAVVLVEGDQLKGNDYSEDAALNLLHRFLLLEKEFGRDRKSSPHWGPRSLDIDFLSWGGFHMKNEQLILPHPRLMERNFVITPLAAALSQKGSTITQIAPQKGWQE